ncbi:MAG: malonyl-CoA decarboxylase [Paracoccaceae bacterium]
MLTTLFERRWSASSVTDARSIEEMCLGLLDAEGEVSGTRLATAILDRYAGLEPDAKLAFFQFLNADLEIDPAKLHTLCAQYLETGAYEDYDAILTSAEPRRQELLRRLNQSPGATAALVSMRVDLLRLLGDHPELRRSDLDFVHLLRSWFNRGFLVLREISWNTPASILEKIVAYEAVHAINDWDDLRRRLYPPDRRCYAYFHPTMPDEPLIFVEVALTKNIPNSIQAVLAEDRPQRDTSETRVAVFYSISNCQAGLQGISFGNLLIKQVADELSQALPQIETFVTLSPIPGLMRWLSGLNDTPIAQRLTDGTGSDAELREMAAHYLLTERNASGAARDPVARFHLGNGAQIHAVHAQADLTEKGQAQSGGAMVNYLYDLTQIEKNHETYVQGDAVPASKAVTALAHAAKAHLAETPPD